MKSDREQSFKKHNYVHCVEVSGIELPVMILIFVEYPVMKYITSVIVGTWMEIFLLAYAMRHWFDSQVLLNVNISKNTGQVFPWWSFFTWRIANALNYLPAPP